MLLEGAAAGWPAPVMANYDDSEAVVHDLLWVVDGTHTKCGR